jgi:hypothetical protein
MVNLIECDMKLPQLFRVTASSLYPTALSYSVDSDAFFYEICNCHEVRTSALRDMEAVHALRKVDNTYYRA